VTIEKKSLVNNLKTAKKANVSSTPTDAKVSAKVTPRALSRIHTRVKAKFSVGW
jgi:hypothetical protein